MGGPLLVAVVERVPARKRFKGRTPQGYWYTQSARPAHHATVYWRSVDGPVFLSSTRAPVEMMEFRVQWTNLRPPAWHGLAPLDLEEMRAWVETPAGAQFWASLVLVWNASGAAWHAQRLEQAAEMAAQVLQNEAPDPALLAKAKRLRPSRRAAGAAAANLWKDIDSLKQVLHVNAKVRDSLASLDGGPVFVPDLPE